MKHSLGLLVAIGCWGLPLVAVHAAEPSPSPGAAVTSPTDVSAQEDEIAKLTQKIVELKAKQVEAGEEAELIATMLQAIRAQLKKAELELARTQGSLTDVRSEQEATTTEIDLLQDKLVERRGQLRDLVRLLYVKEQVSLMTLFLRTGSLSDVISEREAVQQLQDESISLIQTLRAEEQELHEKEQRLEEQETELHELTQLHAAQQEELAAQRHEQDVFLHAKQDEQLKYQQQLAAAQAARKEIEQNIFTLKNAKVQVKLTDATEMAQYAAKLTGVRAAIILAVLKVESNVGESIGTGTFPDDMQPASREPFIRITKKLGLDPATAPISRRPAGGWGWGGAMGPAQVMPQTWEGIEGRIASLMGKAAANPYELQDAFVATGIFLADRGAAQRAGEYEAVNRYIAGPNWQRFIWYGDRVMAIAAEYEKEGL